MRFFLLILTSVLLTVSTASAQTSSDRVTVLVLDASGSMWAQLPEGRSRIEVARDVLDDFLGARPAGAPLGVIAYGHRRKGDCSDIDVIAGVAVQDRTLAARLRALSPTGKTPIADALRLAVSQIPAEAEQADIVLVTDGLETCGGDPCAVAAEMAQAGLPLRAHVVGFGLTEGEVQQIACIAEETGGLILATQSGAELSEALLRTTTAPAAAPVLPGTAAINLSIRADIAGRPDRVTFRATEQASGEMRELGSLDFAKEDHLAVELAEGTWLITADGGEQGSGEITSAIVAGQNTTIYVPFRGLLPGLDMPAPTGAFRAGINGLMPYRITQEGLATGGGDFVFSVLPVDAADTYDRRIDYATQDSLLGGHVGTFRTPVEPGEYLLAFHRNAQMPIDEVMERFVIRVEARPEVTLVAPPAVEPGTRVPVTIAGGMGNSDRIEIWRDGQLYSWDQSIYVQEFFDNRYGPAKPLLAPAEPGAYELVYVFSEVPDDAAVAARLPLTVGAVPAFDDAARATPEVAPADGHGQDAMTARAWSDYPFRCLPDDKTTPICEMDDAATGLHFFLPENWVAEVSTGPDGPRADFFEVTGDARSMHLNPTDWPTPDSGCFFTRAGPLCTDMAGMDETLSKALNTLRRYMTTGQVLRNCGNETCPFLLPWQGFSGTLPRLWGVEVGRILPDGTLSSWFFSATPDSELKVIGLNQPGGADCIETALGQSLCAFTPNISTAEIETIASTLRVAPPPARGAVGRPAAEVDADAFSRAIAIIEGN